MTLRGWPVTAGWIIGTIVLMAGCASSELIDVWSGASSLSQGLRKVLVISSSRNPVQRRIWEDAFCGELVKRDVEATPSYTLFPDALPDTAEVVRVVRSSGFDGVLVTRRLPPELTTRYLQGYVTTEEDLRYDRYRDRFVRYYKEVEHPGYLDSQKVLMRAIDVWTTGDDGRIIWSATSKTPEPASMEPIRHDIVELVMSELTERRIIADKH